jgi:hypothetical protein
VGGCFTSLIGNDSAQARELITACCVLVALARQLDASNTCVSHLNGYTLLVYLPHRGLLRRTASNAIISRPLGFTQSAAHHNRDLGNLR